MMPQATACRFIDSAGTPVRFSAQAGIMNGGTDDFTVAALIRSRNPGTTASLAALETIAQSGVAGASGWRLFRAAGAAGLSFEAYDGSAEVVTFPPLAFGGGMMLQLLIARVVGGATIEAFHNGVLVDTEAIDANITVGSTALFLGSSPAAATPSEFHDLLAFGYAESALSDETIMALMESAVATGRLYIPSVGSAPSANDLNLDYIWQARDLINTSAPGGVNNEISAGEADISTPIGLSTWQQATALVQLQPSETAPATSIEVLTRAGGVSGPQLPSASLAFASPSNAAS